MLNVDAADTYALRTWELRSDLLMAAGLAKDHGPRANRQWKPIFCSRQFVKDHQQINIEDFELSRDELYTLGQQVTQLRSTFRQQAVDNILQDCR